MSVEDQGASDGGDNSGYSGARVRLSFAQKLVSRMQATTFRLRVGGFVALALTLANLATLIGGVVALADAESYEYTAGFLVGNAVLGFGSLLLLGVLEASRKHGDAMFQELSDTLQWFAGRRSRAAGSSIEKLSQDARFALRSYSGAADVPLVPGRFGVSVYALVNLLVVLASLLVYVALQPSSLS